MAIFSSTTGCPAPDTDGDVLVGQPVVGNMTSHTLMTILAGAAAAVTLLISVFLIWKHLHRYTEPRQQRQIVRILFTPFVYAVFSFLSVLDYNAAKFLSPVATIYEGFALASLFLLFVEYLVPNGTWADRRQYFNKAQDPKSGQTSLAFYQRTHMLVFLFVIVNTVMSIVEIGSQATGDYCQTSLSPRFAHFWVLVVRNVAVVVAVMSILNFYKRFNSVAEFKAHKPILKLISFKLIVFINFVQTIIFSVLSGKNVLKGSSTLDVLDLNIGLPNILLCFEQVCFAIFFHYSFRSREYHEESRVGGPRRLSVFAAIASSLNPLDLLSGFAHMLDFLTGGNKRSMTGSYEFVGNNSAGNQNTSQYSQPSQYQPNYGYNSMGRNQDMQAPLYGHQEPLQSHGRYQDYRMSREYSPENDQPTRIGHVV